MKAMMSRMIRLVIRPAPPLLLAGLLCLRAIVPADAEAQRKAERVLPISAALCADMKARHVLNPGAPVGCDRLRLVTFGYVGFDGTEHGDGQIVVLDAIADRVLEIFKTLYERRFPVESAKLMNEYDGSDDASMDRNNTSSFNVRAVAGGSSISLHAYGLAIDLNPVQNPFLQRAAGKVTVSPAASAAYLDRGKVRPGMAETVVDVFANHGLTVWGGEWATTTDYQHFQVDRKMANELARLSPADAKALFERHVARYRACVQNSRGKSATARRACARASG
jgi:hypothetical protein